MNRAAEVIVAAGATSAIANLPWVWLLAKGKLHTAPASRLVVEDANRHKLRDPVTGQFAEAQPGAGRKKAASKTTTPDAATPAAPRPEGLFVP